MAKLASEDHVKLIKRATAEHFGISVQALAVHVSDTQTYEARITAMYVAFKDLACSLKFLSEHFNWRNTVTLKHELEQRDLLLQEDQEFADTVRKIRIKIDVIGALNKKTPRQTSKQRSLATELHDLAKSLRANRSDNLAIAENERGKIAAYLHVYSQEAARLEQVVKTVLDNGKSLDLERAKRRADDFYTNLIPLE